MCISTAGKWDRRKCRHKPEGPSVAKTEETAQEKGRQSKEQKSQAGVQLEGSSHNTGEEGEQQTGHGKTGQALQQYVIQLLFPGEIFSWGS